MLFELPALTARELEVLDDVAALRRKLRSQLVEPRRWHGSLRRISMARAIQGSNSIEGYNAALDDAAAIEMDEQPLDAHHETYLAYRAYGDAMTYVLQMADDEDFSYSAQLLKSLHFVMTNYDLAARPGRWRAGAIFVQDEESGRIVYEGPEVEDVPGLISELVDDLNANDDGPPLARGAMAHLNLVMIHPFRDGNGRMARCLQSLVLAREGILAPAFSSIEEYLGRNTRAYYEVLAAVGGGDWNPSNDARPWLRFILTAHLRQARTLLRRVNESERLWTEIDRLVAAHGLPERSQHALFDAAVGMRVRNATYRAVLADMGDEITDATASRDFRQLVDTGMLDPHGERRGRYYTAGTPIRRVRQGIVDARNPRDDVDPFARP